MSERRPPICEFDLLAYADDRLEPGRRVEVDDYLATDPAAAARVAAFRRQTEALHRLYDPVLEEPVPERLSSLLERPRRRVFVPLLRLAAVIVLTIGAGSAGWWLRGQGDGSRLAAEAFLDRAGRAAVHPGAGFPHARVVDLSDGPVEAPDLRSHGYRLATISRTDDKAPLIRLDYESSHGAISLFMGVLPRERTAPKAFGQGGGGLWWVDGPYVYALAGADPNLGALAEAVRRQTVLSATEPFPPLATTVDAGNRTGSVKPDSVPDPGGVELLPDLSTGQL